MTGKLLLFLTVLFSISTFGQTKTILDKESKEPIPYVNISVCNEKIEFNADENGLFTLPKSDESKTVRFSAVGYDTASLKVSEIQDTIYLESRPITLNEVVISSKKRENTITIKTKKAKKTWYGAGGGMNGSLMSARYIPFKPEYTTTPYIDKVRLKINVQKEYTFNIRLYSVKPDGSPGDYLYGENILVTVDKKQKYAEVDLSKIPVRIPEEGLFIVMEHLAIKANRLTILGDDDSYPAHLYAYGPTTLYEATESNEGWTYKNGSWIPNPKTENGYAKMFMEITLTD